MLTEEQKSTIRAEEYFKYEIRRSLEKKQKPTFRERVWILLNSSFGLWVLSTVVVGLIVYSYSHFQEKIAINASNKEMQRKLETEIANRVQYLQIELKRILSDGDFNPGTVGRAAISLDAGAYRIGEEQSLSHVFPEFKARTLQSLIFELEQLDKNEKDEADLKEARLNMNSIKQMLLNMPDNYFPSDLDTARASGVISQEELAREKTKQNEAEKKHQEINKKYKSSIEKALGIINSNVFLKRWSGT